VTAKVRMPSGASATASGYLLCFSFGSAWGWHGVGMGLAWGSHGVSMGLARGWHGVGMGPHGVGMGYTN
jgi:hypothetical protein